MSQTCIVACSRYCLIDVDQLVPHPLAVAWTHLCTYWKRPSVRIEKLGGGSPIKGPPRWSSVWFLLTPSDGSTDTLPLLFRSLSRCVSRVRSLIIEKLILLRIVDSQGRFVGCSCTRTEIITFWKLIFMWDFDTMILVSARVRCAKIDIHCTLFALNSIYLWRILIWLWKWLFNFHSFVMCKNIYYIEQY